MERDELYQELQDCCMEVIKLHPGCKFNEWKTTLMEQYATELTDVFGCMEKDVMEGIDNLWSSDYTDPFTAETRTFSEWAATICDSDALKCYYNRVN